MQTIRICRPPAMFRRPSVRARSGVIPEMHTILQTYVCPMVNQCTDIFIGTEEHQQLVLSKLHAIANKYDIAQSEVYVIRALLLDDDKLAVSIADATDIYHKSMDLVRQNISKLPNIHTLPHA
ncbi:hypothetical protein PBCVCVB1_224R [Paramecium bursaria Chlorella virus CVB-1]|nr:hypothetical protein PBCVCVB1_224R [Paramecium bursaria Chlorella virus CVB-1]